VNPSTNSSLQKQMRIHEIVYLAFLFLENTGELHIIILRKGLRTLKTVIHPHQSDIQRTNVRPLQGKNNHDLNLALTRHKGQEVINASCPKPAPNSADCIHCSNNRINKVWVFSPGLIVYQPLIPHSITLKRTRNNLKIFCCLKNSL
jgi:hypothetical protein